MNEKQAKIAELIENEEFNKKAEGATSTEELVALFAEYGVEVTEEEISSFAARAGAELDESNLEDVSGGVRFIGMPNPTPNPQLVAKAAIWLWNKLHGK